MNRKTCRQALVEEAKQVLLDEDRHYEDEIQRRRDAVVVNTRSTVSKGGVGGDGDPEIECHFGREEDDDDEPTSKILTTTTNNLLHLRDRLFEALGFSESNKIAIVSSLSSTSSHQTAHDSDVCGSGVVNSEIETTLEIQLDLYRSLWVACRILLDVINNVTLKCGSGDNTHNNDDDDNTMMENQKNFTLLICDRCSVLVSLIQRQQQQQTQQQQGDNESRSRRHHYKDDTWERLVHKWTVEKQELDQVNGANIHMNDAGFEDNKDRRKENYADYDDGDDDTDHVLSFTREQLIEEEQELILMASIPIPGESA